MSSIFCTPDQQVVNQLCTGTVVVNVLDTPTQVVNQIILHGASAADLSSVLASIEALAARVTALEAARIN